VLPTVLDVTVETPDYTHLTLKVRTANQLSRAFLHELRCVQNICTGLHMLVFCTFAAASTYKSFCGYEPPVIAICNYYAHVNGVHVQYIHKRSSAAGARADLHKGHVQHATKNVYSECC